MSGQFDSQEPSLTSTEISAVLWALDPYSTVESTRTGLSPVLSAINSARRKLEAMRDA